MLKENITWTKKCDCVRIKNKILNIYKDHLLNSPNYFYLVKKLTVFYP